MTKSLANMANFSDAAAVLLATVSGDDEAAQSVVRQVALGDNARQELAAALTYTIHAATAAIQRELSAAVERGDDQCPAVDYLVAASRQAHRQDE